ncbi:TadE/TadG family type IV pilus assembly protein [Aureimonas jatrophae]|uniref:Flp pilus assembly protein TadG n=1 Tax=Aureimonas jatrophae TaxID=1166073 RepID=A0A1H0K123_9HYPH|nr:TadE/TadG family type IV pilus assembly protein [Aureimonas jatrophae]MBB3950902.1 Flp pilus assembly protein TadG [Aureimonas jatrophae]SDO49738.1 Flp pilus assembly protein TadG [Aureimonas jatrophae]
MSVPAPHRSRGLRPLRGLLADRRGNVALIFAIAAPVLVAATGVAIDMTNLQAQGVALQNALDAGALSAAKEYGHTQDKNELKRIAEAYFTANLGTSAVMPTTFHFDGVVLENGNNVLKVSAERVVPQYFGPAIQRLIGGDAPSSRTLQRASQIVIQNRSIELALVLDNSGSMNDPPAGGGASKISTLKTATTNLVNQMLTASTSNVQYPVSISVVPFSGAVKVGTTYANASWMDTKGISPEHHDDFDWSTWKVGPVRQAVQVFDLYGSPYWVKAIPSGVTVLPGTEALTRFYLYKHAVGAGSWAGCVMSRPNGYAVTDDAPTESNPSTLFVPTFAPAEAYWKEMNRNLGNDWITADGTARSDKDAIVAQRDMNRYFNGKKNPANYATGPNFVCNTQPITPLTKTKSTILSSVSGMVASGGTNIMEGLAWGWRTLTSREPFPEGKPARTRDNLKVIVLMTDGENTYNASNSLTGQQVEMASPGHSLYGTYGYAQILQSDPKLPNAGQLRPGRMFDSVKTTSKQANITQVTAAMNENMSLVCENAKSDGRNEDGSDGIVIFTIAFDLKDGSPVKDRLRACASNGISGRGAKLYYDARSSADLNRAFADITEEISSLRIAR